MKNFFTKLFAELAVLEKFVGTGMVVWGIVAANLTQLGAPVQIASVGAAALSVVALLVHRFKELALIVQNAANQSQNVVTGTDPGQAPNTPIV